MHPTLVFPDSMKQNFVRRQKDMAGDRTLSATSFPSSKQHAQSLLGGVRKSIAQAEFMRKHGVTKQFLNAPLMRPGKRGES